MPIEQLPSWLEHLVRNLKWTYGALWASGANPGPVRWKDGWYCEPDKNIGLSIHDSQEQPPRIEALFYLTYKACLFAPGFGLVGQVLTQRQDAWLTGSEEIHCSAVHPQILFLKTVICIPWQNNVLELGTVEKVSRNEDLLHQIKLLLSYVTIVDSAQPIVPDTCTSHDMAHPRERIDISSTFAVTNNNMYDPSYSVIVNSSPGRSHRPNLSDFVVTHGLPKDIDSLVTQSYQQIQQGTVPEGMFQPLNQDITLQKEKLSKLESVWRPKTDDYVAIGFSGWGVPRVGLDLFSVSESAIDPITSNGMRLTEMSAIASSMALLPLQNFSHHSQQLEERSLSFDHDILSSAASSSSTLVNTDIHILPNHGSSTPRQSPAVTDSGLSPNNWHHIRGAGIGIAKNSPDLREVFERYRDEGQHTQTPGQQFQSVIVNEQKTCSNWPLKGDFGAQNHQHHPHFQSPSYLETSSTVHPTVHVQPQSWPTAPNMQATQESTLGSLDQLESRITFKTPTTWVPWTRRVLPTRYNPRQANSGPVTVRVNQQVLKRMLLNVVPRIAEDQKAREREELEAMNTDDASSGYRVQASSYPMPLEHTMSQDPQARTHMLAERRRRVRENENYSALRALIPPNSRMDKVAVLGEIIQLVKRLKKRIRSLEKVNPALAAEEDCYKVSPSAAFSSSDHPPKTSVATSQGSERGDDLGSPPAAACPRVSLKEAGGEETTKADSTSSADPMITGRTEPAAPPSRIPSHSVKEEGDREEIVRVFTTDGKSQKQLVVEIRTLSQSSDMIIHILTCFKELSLQVMKTHITVNNNWMCASFQLKMDKDQSSPSSLFCEQVQEALETSIALVPKHSSSIE